VGNTLYVGRDRATMWEEYWTASEDINVLSARK
jgi:hypothetical protein